ncbi:MAG: hypothetical protein D6695_09010 [Planctomycetota bacterium]|nr:MAG: hypothetical protein D6695_09010 [Planctomycetota bacterium]
MMHGWALAILIAGAVVFEMALIYVIMRATVGATFRKLSKAYPFRAPGEDAVRKNFQSFKFGVINAGFAVHVAVDADHLHLMPAAILRWCGAQPASVPWSEVELKGKMGSFRRARVGGVDLYGPRWCLDLACPAGD